MHVIIHKVRSKSNTSHIQLAFYLKQYDLKDITNQHDEVSYLTSATYNFYFMISQITTARGIALDCENKQTMAHDKASIHANKLTIHNNHH